MKQTPVRACPICARNLVDVLHTQRFELPRGHPLSDGYDVVCCRTCGFVYADTEVSQASYDAYYSELSKYQDVKTSSGSGENPFDQRRLEDTAREIAHFLRNPAARILDVGCANGGLLRALREAGYANLCGVDPSQACVENTHRLGIQAYPGALSQPFEHGRVDCTILSHTLEHVQNLNEATQWIGSVLAENGTVYIEVPDATHYVDHVRAPFQDFNTEHINHFSLLSLRRLMNRAGYGMLTAGEKLFVTAKDTNYPAIFGFWRKAEAGLAMPELPRDEDLKGSIVRYIRASRTLLDGIEARLQEILPRSGAVVVWGTGQLVLKLLVETSLGKSQIAAFVDSNPINQGRVLRGVSVVAPEAVRGLAAPIVIGTTLHQAEIVEQIRQMGLPNEILLLKAS
jgi:2-polyprenyl-3-methyl-5-hydroxy-6-metoxy-1,4-benzoquinol methylase